MLEPPPAKRLKGGAVDGRSSSSAGGGGGGGGGGADSAGIARKLYNELVHSHAVPGLLDAVPCKTVATLLCDVVQGGCSARIRKHGLTTGWKNFARVRGEQMADVSEEH